MKDVKNGLRELQSGDNPLQGFDPFHIAQGHLTHR